MPAEDNPAGRLYEILDEARKRGDQLHTRQVWGSVLHVNPANNSELLPAPARLMMLVKEARQSVQELEEINHELYLKPFEQIERAFQHVNLEESWQRFKSQLDDPTMVALAFCADTLSREGGEIQIDSEKLQKFQEEVNSLLEDIIQSDINQELKDFIIRGLEEIRRAIFEYRLGGSEGLRKALEMNLGGMFFNAEEIQKEKRKKVVSRYLEVINTLLNLVTIALNIKQITGPITNLLLPGGTP
jgi:hypothetical protein